MSGQARRDDRSRTVDESWIHVQLSPSVDPSALAEAQRMLPLVLADARQVAQDSAALNAVLRDLAEELSADSAPGSPVRTATTSRACCVGSATVTSYSWVTSAAR